VVLEYVDHDLTGLLDERYVFQPDEVKCVMRQLLEVLKYLHDEKFVHRDLKCSNLLLSHDGTLKLADFGLARSIEPTYTGPSKTLDKLTNNVITLWYRPPELLLGLKKYSTPVDMWSAGCILAELILRKPLFPGKTELEQLDLIFRVLGTPTPSTWPQHESLPRFAALQPKEPYARTLEERYAERFAVCNRHALSLTVHLLNLDPSRRRTAKAALELPFFAGVTAQSRHPLRVASGAAFHEWKTKEARRKARAQAEQRTDNNNGGGGVNGSSSSGGGMPGNNGNGKAVPGASSSAGNSSNSSNSGNPWSISADDIAPHRPVPHPGLPPRLPPGMAPPGMQPPGAMPPGTAMGMSLLPGLPPPPRPPLPPPAGAVASSCSAGMVNGLIARRAGLPQPPAGPPPWSSAAAPPPSSSSRGHGVARPRHDSVDMDESPPHPAASTNTSSSSRAAPSNGRSPPRKDSRSGAQPQPSSSSSRPRSRTPPRGASGSASGGGGSGSGGGGGGHDTDDFLANFVDEKPVPASYVYGKNRARSRTPPQTVKATGDICDELAAMAGLQETSSSTNEQQAAAAAANNDNNRGRGPSRGGGGSGGGNGSSRGRRSGRDSSSDSSSSSSSSSSRSRSRSPSRGHQSKSSTHKSSSSSSRRSSSRAWRSSRSRSRDRGGGGHRREYSHHSGYSDSRNRRSRSRSRSRSRDRSYRR